MLIKQQVHGFVNKVFRSKGGLWIPLLGIVVPKHKNVLAIVGTPRGNVLYASHNLVTDEGDRFYAQRAAGETATNNFANCYLSTDPFSPAPAKDTDSDDLASVLSGSEKSPSATYPKTDDDDADNTGAGVDVITWLYSWAKADFNDSDIEGLAIAVAGVTSWGVGAGVDQLLTAVNQAAFEKTANDTLKIFVNHTQNGI